MASKELLDEIVRDLNSLGLNPNNLSDNEIIHITKLHTEITSRFKARDEALSTIKANKININSITKAGVLSNKTIYKYPILTAYITASDKQYSKSLSYNSKQVKDLKNKLNEANNLIQALEFNILDQELMQYEIDQLQVKLEDYRAKLDALQEENIALRNELKHIKPNTKNNTNNNTNNNIIQLKND